MKDEKDNRISREDLLSLLRSIIAALKYVRKEQDSKLSEFSHTVYGKSFTLYRNPVRFFRNKKVEVVDMTPEIYKEIVEHDGRGGFVKYHIKTYEDLLKTYEDTYEYYYSLINQTFIIDLSTFSRYRNALNFALAYNVEELGKRLVETFCGEKYIELRSHDYDISPY